MVPLKNFITQELQSFNEEQLKQVADFIAFLKFKSRVVSRWTIDENQIAAIYREFGDEDRKLAEEGIDEYADMLKQEDSK